MSVVLPRSPRILVVMVSALGDAVHVLPVIGALRRRYASAHISWVLLARAGRTVDARRVQAELVERWDRGEGGAFEVALVHAGLGDLDQVFDWLDRAVADHSLTGGPGDPGALTIVGPLFEEFRRDPRYERLRERLG